MHPNRERHTVSMYVYFVRIVSKICGFTFFIGQTINFNMTTNSVLANPPEENKRNNTITK